MAVFSIQVIIVKCDVLDTLCVTVPLQGFYPQHIHASVLPIGLEYGKHADVIMVPCILMIVL